MPRFGLPAEGLQSKFEEDGPSLCSYYWDVGDMAAWKAEAWAEQGQEGREGNFGWRWIYDP